MFSLLRLARLWARAQLRRCRGAVALLALLLALAPPAAADPLSEAIQRGDASAARAILETQIAGRPDAALHRQQLDGLLALREGRPDLAAAIFRKILAQAPGYRPAQVQLVIAMDLMGQGAEALHMAQSVAATTDDTRLRDALLAEISTRDWGPAEAKSSKPPHRGGVVLRFSLLPSTNLTGGTRQETVIIGGLPFVVSPASREKAGTGLSLGLTAWHAWDLAQDWRAVLTASADRRVFDTALRPAETELDLRFALSHRSGRTVLSFGPKLNMLWLDGRESRRQLGLFATGTHRVAPRLQLAWQADWLDQSYPGAAYRDGHKVSGLVELSYALGRDSQLTLSLPLERETARAPHLAHRDIGLGLGLETRLKGGLHLGLDLATSVERYDGAYPVFGVARRDRVSSLRLSVSHPDLGWGGLMPEISVTRKHRDSNIPLHESWTTEFGLALVKRF